jgi:membrane protein implicated in regulation of membrane protease activity
MQVIDFLSTNAPWSWIIAELVVPGGILLWMGISGIAVGIAVLLWPIAWPLQWLIFGVLSLVTIFAWVRFARSRPTPTDRPYLNRRAEQYLGQEALLDQPIAQGFGRITLGDTVWRVAGPDLPAGTRVRVVGADGNVLRVEMVG